MACNLINQSKHIIMSTQNRDDQNKKNNQDAPVKPDEETLHTPDPQKNMEGPISSLMHKTGHGFESGESKKDADEKKEENM
jgi:hypothetical protein